MWRTPIELISSSSYLGVLRGLLYGLGFITGGRGGAVGIGGTVGTGGVGLIGRGFISETGLLGGDWNNTLLLGAVVVRLIEGFGKVPKVDAKETGLARTLGGGGHQ